MIRDKNTNRADFIFYSNRINRLLVEEALNHLPVLPHTITTPVGRTYAGVKFEGKICGVSIMRAGEAMEQALTGVLSECEDRQDFDPEGRGDESAQAVL